MKVLLLFRHVRPTDQETTDLFLTVPKKRGKTSHLRATQGSTRVGQEAEGGTGKTGAGILMVVSMGKVR